MMNVQMPGKSFGTFVFHDSANVKVSRPLPEANSSRPTLSLVAHIAEDAIRIELHGKNFAGQLVRLNGSVKIPALVSRDGSLIIGTSGLGRGVYLVKGFLDQQDYCAAIIR
jgi:hypothetical protein